MYPNVYTNKQISIPEPINVKSEEKSATAILKSAIDYIGKALVTHDVMSRNCHMLGLQGHKRLHRFYCNKAMKLLQKLQHYSIDMYNENIESDMNIEILQYSDVKTYLDLYSKFINQQLCDISTCYKQCIENSYIKEASLIKSYICDLTKQLKKCNRYMHDFTNANWDWTYIKISDNKLHNKMKCKEAKHYYKD